ncbi:hypothetical protein CEXT_430511 [Caerostris extrusa]|uniref:Uncharacterized protein n=1 Tax=Caerostris extrusa TaxID=172846 RepID=A0AAV4XNY3_CAEEX|nr:hypothetical protein CEXT_430511 [Caerostris extrusa]
MCTILQEREIRTVAERSTRQRRTPLFLGHISWAKIRFFSLYWTSSIMQEPRQETSGRENTLFLHLARQRHQSKGGVPSFIWETTCAVDSPKFPESQAEKGRSRCSVRENKEQPVASWGAISEAQCVHVEEFS